jgi:hypothetical protein
MMASDLMMATHQKQSNVRKQESGTKQSHRVKVRNVFSTRKRFEASNLYL